MPVPASPPPPGPAAQPVAERLTLDQARRLALAAAGLHRPRPDRAGAVTARHLQQLVDRLGVLQIDSVNVFARAHLMPLYSRVGPYDPALVERAAARNPRRLVEAWAHQASYVRPEDYRLFDWRRQDYAVEAWGSIREVPQTLGAVVEDVLAMLAAEGPLTGAQVHDRLQHEHPGRGEGWGWNWTVAKRVLEYLFFTGQVTSAGRNGAFERRYDLVERVLPAHVLRAPVPSRAEAVRALVAGSVRALGIGTLRDVADYYRLRTVETVVALGELVESGDVVPVQVAGWGDGRGWRHRDAPVVPRRASGRALLSPFDPLVWERRRVETLFGLRYRIEIYVPEPQRVWGYYVLPFLLGDRIAALVDLKADRKAGVLRVHAAHPAPVPAGHHADAGPTADVAAELAAELRLAASWTGLEEVVVGDRAGALRGDLAPGLVRALARPQP